MSAREIDRAEMVLRLLEERLTQAKAAGIFDSRNDRGFDGVEGRASLIRRERHSSENDRTAVPSFL